MIAENLSTAVVTDLQTLVKSMKDDRRKVSWGWGRRGDIWKEEEGASGAVKGLELCCPPNSQAYLRSELGRGDKLGDESP